MGDPEDKDNVLDMRNVYRSRHAKDVFDLASQNAGFGKLDIACLSSFNERDRDSLGVAKSVLILHFLKDAISLAKDFRQARVLDTATQSAAAANVLASSATSWLESVTSFTTSARSTRGSSALPMPGSAISSLSALSSLPQIDSLSMGWPHESSFLTPAPSVTPSFSVVSGYQPSSTADSTFGGGPSGRARMAEVLSRVCQEVGTLGPPDVSIPEALAAANEALGISPMGSTASQVKVLVAELEIEGLPGWTPRRPASHPPSQDGDFEVVPQPPWSGDGSGAAVLSPPMAVADEMP